jgi:hypothetical protein
LSEARKVFVIFSNLFGLSFGKFIYIRGALKRWEGQKGRKEKTFKHLSIDFCQENLLNAGESRREPFTFRFNGDGVLPM